MAPYNLKCRKAVRLPPMRSSSMSDDAVPDGPCLMIAAAVPAPKQTAPAYRCCLHLLPLSDRRKPARRCTDDGLVGDTHMDLGGGSPHSQPAGAGGKHAEPHLSGLQLHEKVCGSSARQLRHAQLSCSLRRVLGCAWEHAAASGECWDVRGNMRQPQESVGMCMGTCGSTIPRLEWLGGGGGVGANEGNEPGELVLKFECQMYKSRDDEYLIDMQRLSGDAFVFMETVTRILTEMRLSAVQPGAAAFVLSRHNFSPDPSFHFDLAEHEFSWSRVRPLCLIAGSTLPKDVFGDDVGMLII
eukprot:366380-Chlamydomonas_euryale.AAC.5